MKFWSKKLKGNDHFKIILIRIILKRILRKEGRSVAWIHIIEDRDWRWALGNSYEYLDSTKGRAFHNC
jgi:hypothetical protein